MGAWRRLKFRRGSNSWLGWLASGVPGRDLPCTSPPTTLELGLTLTLKASAEDIPRRIKSSETQIHGSIASHLCAIVTARIAAVELAQGSGARLPRCACRVGELVCFREVCSASTPPTNFDTPPHPMSAPSVHAEPPPEVVADPEGLQYATGPQLGKGGFAICHRAKLLGHEHLSSNTVALKIVKSKMEPPKLAQKVLLLLLLQVLQHAC
jgi:hypothetical protein